MVAQLSLEVAGALSIWLEAILYGMYCSLYCETLYIIFKKRMTKTTPAKVFLIVSLIMFGLATVHIGLNLYRLLRGYIWLRDTVGANNYFLDLGRWDNVAHDLVNALMTWCADFLVIYRCFLVWGNNYYVVLLPALLLGISIVANSVALHLFTLVPLGTIFGPTLVHWINTIYALAFVQNSMTTGLIAYRIWQQDRRSAAMGVYSPNSQSSLVPVVRIIIESAAIYLLELLILIVLYALQHNAQFVLQEAVVPTVGIIFTLMTVRISMRTREPLATTNRPSEGTIPIGWNFGDKTVGTLMSTGAGGAELNATENSPHPDSALELKSVDFS